jgi:hypothetical protein
VAAVNSFTLSEMESSCAVSMETLLGIQILVLKLSPGVQKCGACACCCGGRFAGGLIRPACKSGVAVSILT